MRQKVSSSDFVDYWVHREMRRENELKDVKIEHFYLAQIVAEQVRASIADPEIAKTIKVEDFLLKFKLHKEENKPMMPVEATKELTEAELKEKIMAQKRLFAGIFGAPLPPGC